MCLSKKRRECVKPERADPCPHPGPCTFASQGCGSGSPGAKGCNPFLRPISHQPPSGSVDLCMTVCPWAYGPEHFPHVMLARPCFAPSPHAASPPLACCKFGCLTNFAHPCPALALGFISRCSYSLFQPSAVTCCFVSATVSLRLSSQQPPNRATASSPSISGPSTAQFSTTTSRLISWISNSADLDYLQFSPSYLHGISMGLNVTVILDAYDDSGINLSVPLPPSLPLDFGITPCEDFPIVCSWSPP